MRFAYTNQVIAMQSVEKLYILPSTIKDIGETLSTLHAQEKLQNRQCLLKVFLPSFFVQAVLFNNG